MLVEPFEAVVGFTRFEQFIYRSAAEREGKADAKSRAGDLDLVIYSLRKYLRLCLQPARSWLYALRQGQIPKPQMLARATEIEDALRAAIDTSPLPEEPDQAAVEVWMLHLPPRLGRGRPALRSVAPACRFGYDRRSARSRARLAQW